MRQTCIRTAVFFLGTLAILPLAHCLTDAEIEANFLSTDVFTRIDSREPYFEMIARTGKRRIPSDRLIDALFSPTGRRIYGDEIRAQISEGQGLINDPQSFLIVAKEMNSWGSGRPIQTLTAGDERAVIDYLARSSGSENPDSLLLQNFMREHLSAVVFREGMTSVPTDDPHKMRRAMLERWGRTLRFDFVKARLAEMAKFAPNSVLKPDADFLARANNDYFEDLVSVADHIGIERTPFMLDHILSEARLNRARESDPSPISGDQKKRIADLAAKALPTLEADQASVLGGLAHEGIVDPRIASAASDMLFDRKTPRALRAQAIVYLGETGQGGEAVTAQIRDLSRSPIVPQEIRVAALEAVSHFKDINETDVNFLIAHDKKIASNRSLELVANAAANLPVGHPAYDALVDWLAKRANSVKPAERVEAYRGLAGLSENSPRLRTAIHDIILRPEDFYSADSRIAEGRGTISTTYERGRVSIGTILTNANLISVNGAIRPGSRIAGENSLPERAPASLGKKITAPIKLALDFFSRCRYRLKAVSNLLR